MACGEDHSDGRFPKLTRFEQKMIDIKTKNIFDSQEQVDESECQNIPKVKK